MQECDANPPGYPIVRRIRHLRTKRYLSAYIDDEVPTRARPGVVRHLSECPECVAMVESLRSARAALRRVVGQPVDPLAAGRIHRYAVSIDDAAGSSGGDGFAQS